MVSIANPLVSVVMPSLNQAQFIGYSIESVLEQTYPHVELVVADGGSSDATLDILRDWQARDARVRWFSQRDAGPADAVNKAMARSRGTIIGWLNSDDLYTAGAVERAVQALQQHPEWAAVYGHGEHVDVHGRFLDRYPSLPPDGPVSRFLDGCFICQPTLFLRRSAHGLLGPFDTTLKTAFDYEYWLRLFTLMPGRTGFIDDVQARTRVHSDCITQRMRRQVALEGLAVLKRHLGQAPVHWVLTHIQEILGNTPPGQADAAQRAQITDFLREAGPYLTPGDTEHLARLWPANSH